MSTDGKTYYSGTNSSAGFAVPADYVGGSPSEPDEVINEHNANAKDFRMVNRYQMTRKQALKQYVGDIYVKLMDAIKDTNPTLWEEANSLLEGLEPYRKRWTELQAKLLKQQSAARDLLTNHLDDFSTAFNERSSAMYPTMDDTGKVVNLSEINKVADELNKAIETRVSALLDKYEINGYELGDNLSGFIDSMLQVPVSGNYVDDARTYLEQAFTELASIAENGGGNIRQQYLDAEQAYNEYMLELQKMQDKMKQGYMVNTNREGENENAGKSHKSTAYERVMDEIDPIMPPRIPNYHLALETSPRTCSTCYHFKAMRNGVGVCNEYEAEVKANYVCDAWQNQELSEVHTVVRNVSSKADDWEEPVFASEMIDKDGKPKEILGKVRGQNLEIEPLVDSYAWTLDSFNFSIPQEPDENAALRAMNDDFLPDDIVYSKSFNSLARVASVTTMSGSKYYGVQLIHPNGVTYGTGISTGKDFVMRGNKATKGESRIVEQPVRRTKPRQKAIDTSSVIEHTRNVRDALEAVVETHSNWTTNPISNKDVLNPLTEQLKAILALDDFQNVLTGPKRKYFRALQTAITTIGAARFILLDSAKAIMAIDSSGVKNAQNKKREIAMNAQERAYRNLEYAYNQVCDALDLPSATHGDPAPGREHAPNL